MSHDLSFVYDPENKSIYLVISGDDPWPITIEEARRLSLELLKATRQSMEKTNDL